MHNGLEGHPRSLILTLSKVRMRLLIGHQQGRKPRSQEFATGRGQKRESGDGSPPAGSRGPGGLGAKLPGPEAGDKC